MFADSGSHDEMVSVPGGDLLPEQGDGACEDPAAEWYERSEEGFYGIVGWLAESDAAALEHGELEVQLQARGRELLRCLLGDHFALRTVREERLDGVADAEGVEHRAVERDHERPLASVFGEVTVGRLAYRAKGEANLYVADGLLNLPVEHASHGVRRLAVMESAAGSFEHARDMVHEHTGLALGKRGVEELTVRAAVDFDEFYAERASAEPDPGERSEEEREREKHAVLVLSADGKGIVLMRECHRICVRVTEMERHAFSENQVPKQYPDGDHVGSRSVRRFWAGVQ